MNLVAERTLALCLMVLVAQGCTGGVDSQHSNSGTGGRNQVGSGPNGSGGIGSLPTTIDPGSAGHSGEMGSGSTGSTGGGPGPAAATGGAAGGSSARGGTGGRGAAGGRGGGGAAGGPAGTGGMTTVPVNKVFSQCRFHFGTLDSIAKRNPAMIPEIDYFTPGWMGSSDTFSMSGVCTDTRAGGQLANKLPVIVSYVASFYAKRHLGLADCNAAPAGSTQDLCHMGAQYIQQNLPAIINVYKSYAQGFAACYGTTRPIVFEMEPDWYQYISPVQSQPMTEAQAGTIMGQFVSMITASLPNAVFSMDISPWVGNNGVDNGAEWYSHFDMSPFTFVNTSGGGTDAGTATVRATNRMTWAGVSQATGKPILADTGYGVNGRPAGPDPNWDNAANIAARIADGVVTIAQYSPAATWGATIAAIRAQLGTPRYCP